MALQGSQVGRCGVALVAVKTIGRELQVQFATQAVAVHLGQDGRG